jgi:hypothetical protein
VAPTSLPKQQVCLRDQKHSAGMAELLAEEEQRQHGIAEYTDVDRDQTPGGGTSSVNWTAVNMDTPIQAE